MGIRNWNSSRSLSVQLGRNRSRSDHDDHKPRWLRFWRKIKRSSDQNKNRNSNSNCHTSLMQHGGSSYDADTYQQNFDEGSGRAEPDNLCRSFSARFADPSKIIIHHKNHVFV
uniref:Uncharacterized protein n=1 Tax=Davidia involucrata TaxID=16924 RepID=A0A5B7B970_DAVIN